MIIIKNSAASLVGTLENQKNATNNNIVLEKNEIILLQQTVRSLKNKGQKQICWMMNYVKTYEDTNNESDSIWGKHWKYIIQGENLRPVEGFNIKDLQVTAHNYSQPQFNVKVKPEDEFEINKWIEEMIDQTNNDNVFFPEVAKDYKDIAAQIDELNKKYLGQPDYRSSIVKAVRRPTQLKKAIIQRDGTTCKICRKEGFIKKTGERYCELHHMIELNRNAPNTLQSWNVLVLCATCHRQLHYGKTHSQYLNPGWLIVIDGKEYVFNTI
ncbi:HNH endonuclease signature motif containing protein [Pedobacter nutrimenti]|uniref:5-methylcytosine-specific restriction protein A n=1 Tax=Pedobacter nutrimenti TaxID=1241337 RepID=A0A318UD80_9SPHI|nr:HNH endonuclease signature motif containing protein [Pedobacter nutrimenti]PYF74354.1 5-methylcytosine-specific restriction protein A [Pedobacter nutrimenti]